MGLPDVSRPAPLLTEDNEGFWRAAAGGQLVTQRCVTCGKLLHPPRPMCPICHGLEMEWVELAGTGTVYSYAMLHHPQHPAFSYPVIAALIDLDEGIRLLSNLVGVDSAEVHIGMRVSVLFDAVADGMAVPVFEPREDGK
jgi:uncharacterized OB-fold protein